MTDSFDSKYLKPIQNKLEAKEPVLIVGLGDSLTYGWEASYSYFDLFISKLRRTYCGVEITGMNAGVCGDTAQNGLDRLPRQLDMNPDLVIVQFGINDLYGGVGVNDYAKFLGAIARKGLRNGAVILFITSGPLRHPEERAGINKYYATLKGVAAGYDVPVADLSAYWLEHCKKSGEDLADHYFEDGVHPNDNGYQLMANGLYDIAKNL